MNNNVDSTQKGSVLVIAMLTITIMTMICATTLYITSQNNNAGMQTASWQQALTAADSGIEAAFRALNKNAWGNWKTVTATLPTSEPSSGTGSSASGPPSSGQYNYLPSANLSLSFPNTEGTSSVSTWVTIDTAGMSGIQAWYRVRSTGQTVFLTNNAGFNRVSNNRLDTDLRNTMALKVSRKGSSYLGPTRTIEAIVRGPGPWQRAVTLKDSINMSGGGVIDSYDSSSSSKSTNGQYDVTKRQSQGNVGTVNSAGSDLKSTYIYGSLFYGGASGSVQNTTNVQGDGVDAKTNSGFSATISPASSPSWASGSYTSYTGGGSHPPFTTVAAAGTKNNPTLIKINGDFSTSGSDSVTITAPAGATASNPGYVIIWVTGNYNTSGSSYVQQPAVGVNATWYVGGSITTSGGSYNNGNGQGVASNVNFIGYGTGASAQATISGGGQMVGTFDLPNYGVTISGSGALDGALISDTLNISGGASIHYDQNLANVGGNKYIFVSWFEDNSDPTRNARDTSSVNRPIVY